MNRTLWQKIYNFFGFWSYGLTKVRPEGINRYRVIYWCLFPSPFPFFRKIDLFKVKV